MTALVMIIYTDTVDAAPLGDDISNVFVIM